MMTSFDNNEDEICLLLKDDVGRACLDHMLDHMILSAVTMTL